MLLLAVGWAAAGLAAYQAVLADIVGQWQTHPNYSHGWFVPPVAVFLLWHRRASRPSPAAAWPVALAFIAIAHTLLWAGDYFRIAALARWSLPLWIAGFVGVVLGQSVFVWSLPAIGFLAFMIPLPFRLELVVSQWLQWGSAWVSCLMLTMVQTFATTDGQTLSLPNGQVDITTACSGFRTTVAIAALAAILAVTRRYRLARIVSLAACLVPAALLANGLRIAALAWTVDRYGLQSFAAWVHDLGDWIMVPVAVGLMWLLASLVTQVVGEWARLFKVGSVADAWDSAAPADASNSPNTSRRLAIARIAALPSLVVVASGLITWNYHGLRRQIRQGLTVQAARHEAAERWSEAARSYETLAGLFPRDLNVMFRHAVAAEKTATDDEQRQRALLRYAAILERDPCHAGALRRQLDLALALDLGGASLLAAQRLGAVDRNSAALAQMRAEARIRFADSEETEPPISPQDLTRLMSHVAGKPACRDSFILAAAEYCHRFPRSVDASLRDRLTELLPDTVRRVDSSRAHWVHWRFASEFGLPDATVSLARAADRATAGHCPPRLAYEIRLAAAREARSQGRPDEAERHLQKAFQTGIRTSRGLLELAQLNRAAGRWSDAAPVLRTAWKVGGRRDSEIALRLAESYRQLGQHHLAGRVACRGTELLENESAPSERDLRRWNRLTLVRVRAAMARADYAQALRLAERQRTRRSDPSMPPASPAERRLWKTLYAEALVRSDRFREAAALFQRWADSRSRDADPERSRDLYVAAARAWRSAGETDREIACYRAAIERADGISEHWLEYVTRLAKLRGRDDAIGELAWQDRRCSEPDARTSLLLAQAWENVGLPGPAETRYRRAAAADEQNVVPLAIHLARRGEAAEAIEMLAAPGRNLPAAVRGQTAARIGTVAAELSAASRRVIGRLVDDAIREDGENAELLVAAADWYTREQCPRTAMKLLERAVWVDPNHLVAANNLTMLRGEASSRDQETMGLIEHWIARVGPVAELLDTKGWVLCRMNRPGKAIRWLEQAVAETDAPDPIAHLHLAAAYLAVGDRARAARQWQVVERASPDRERLHPSERAAWTRLASELSSPGGEA